MRPAVWLIMGLLLALLVMDVTTYSLVRSKIREAIEHSLDAALIGGINEDDAARGYLTIDETKGKALARDFFRQTLNIDEQLENESIQGTSLIINFFHNEERPKVTAEVKTTIRAVSPQILGLEGIPVKITKTQYHINKFK